MGECWTLASENGSDCQWDLPSHVPELPHLRHMARGAGGFVRQFGQDTASVTVPQALPSEHIHEFPYSSHCSLLVPWCNFQTSLVCSSALSALDQRMSTSFFAIPVCFTDATNMSKLSKHLAEHPENLWLDDIMPFPLSIYLFLLSVLKHTKSKPVRVLTILS